MANFRVIATALSLFKQQIFSLFFGYFSRKKPKTFQRSLVTATKTRKKQQTEAIRHAIQQQEDKQRAERQSFLLTTIPITQQASHEPGLDHVPGEDHAEGFTLFFSSAWS